MRLADCIHEIRDGDLVLYRGRGIGARMIGVGRDSTHTHAEMVGWWDGDLMSIGMVAWGGRIVRLETLVAREPGLWDWFRLDPRVEFDRPKAVAKMRRFAGIEYGWWNLIRTALRHLPGVRLLTPRLEFEAEPHANGRNAKPYCSQAISIACRKAGADPVPGLPDWETQPADLARSRLFEFAATLE